MKTQLVIMAAGIGSRFGEGIKQLTPVGPKGELIIDYSIHYAKKAGFDEVVFVIRKDIEKDFREVIGDRIEKIIKCKYVYQELDMLPIGFKCPDGRKKPYGTGHCILCAKDAIDSPFLVINADDYYGKEGFVKIHNYLINAKSDEENYNMCMAGFKIDNTLSENGAVTRGICKKDADNMLVNCIETFEIKRREDGKIYGLDDNKNEVYIEDGTPVSMNMWGLPKEFLNSLESRFIEFLKTNNDLKSEFLLPSIINDMLHLNIAKVKVLEVNEKWYGVTYKEDKQYVIDALKNINIEE